MATKYLLTLLFLCLCGISIFGQSASTVKDGDWNDQTVWSGNLVPDASFGIVTIRHTIHVRSAVYSSASPLLADQIMVGADDFAGYLVIDSGAVFQLLNGTGSDLLFEGAPVIGKMDVYGLLTATDGVVFSGNSPSNLAYKPGAVYEHASSSAAAALPSATYDPASTLLINGFTGSAVFPSSWSTPVGNVVYNCTHQGSGIINFAGFLMHIQGNLDIQNTGPTGQVYFNQTGVSIGASAISIAGHLSITGSSRVSLTTTGTVEANIAGDFIFSPDAASGSSQCATSGTGTVHVGGNTTLRQGTWNFSSGANGTGTFDLDGNLISSGAVLTETGSGASAGNLNFIGTAGSQTADLAGLAATTMNIAINNSSGVIVSGDVTFPGTLSLLSGSLTLADARLTLTGPVVQTNGSIATRGKPSLIIAGTGTLPADLSIANGSAFDTFQFNRAATLLTSGSDFTVSILELYAGTLVNNGTVTMASAGWVDLKATTASATGALRHSLKATERYDVMYTNNVALATGPELPQDSSSLASLTKSGTAVLSLNSDVVIQGNLTVTGGTLSDDGVHRTVELAGSYTNNGSSIFSSSTFLFSSGATSTSLSGSANPSFADITFSHPVTINVGLRVDGDLTIDSGVTVVATTGTASFGGTTHISNDGTLALSTVSVLANGIVTANSPLHIASNFSVSASGMFTSNEGSDLTLSGNLSVTGTFTSLARVVFDDTTKITGTGVKEFHDILITGSLTPNAAYAVTGNLQTAGAGTLLAGNSTTTFDGVTLLSNTGTGTINFNNITLATGSSLTAAADFTITGATLTWNDGTFYSSALTQFSRPGITTLRGTGSFTFTTLAIAAGTTFTPNAQYIVAGNFQIDGTLRAGNNKVIFGGTTALLTNGTPSISFNAVEIDSGKLLTSYSGTVTLSGNFTNNGVFDANGGTMVFSGNTTKYISGTSVTRFNNMSVSNGTASVDVSIESDQNLRGVLTLSANAHVDPDGSGNTAVFTLLSTGDDPTADASVATLPTGAQVAGKVTVQRYMSIGGLHRDRIYRYLSSPVFGAPVSDLQNEIPVTGPFTGTSTCSGCGRNPSQFWYDETITTGGINGGYTAFPVISNSETYVTGKGYATFVRGDIDPVLSVGSALYDLTGPINAGLINYAVTYTFSGIPANDGWNLIGNPYPSTIDWNAKGWTKTNVGAAIYMLNNGVYPSLYATWNGTVGTNRGSRNIASGQGFFVRTSGATPSLTSTESVKVAGTSAIYFRQAMPSNVLRITLVQENFRDEAVLHFRDSATAEFDTDYDAIKLKNLQNDDSTTPFFNLSTLTSQGREKLAINTLPSSACSTTISLDVSDVPEGSYELDFSSMESFPPVASILLIDHFASPKSMRDVRQYPVYVFQVTSDSGSLGSGRFEVRVSFSGIPTHLSLHTTSVCVGNDASVSVDSTQEGVTYFLQIRGNQIGLSRNGTGDTLRFSVPHGSLKSGSNVFEVWAQSENCSAATFSQIDSIRVARLYTTQPLPPPASCGKGSVTLHVRGAPPDGHYNWYEDETTTQPIDGTSGPVFETPVLSKTKNYFVSIVDSLGCEGKRAAVVATIVNLDPASITLLDDNTLQSNSTSGNQWYLNGQLLSDTTSTLKIGSSGLYTLWITIDGCTSSDEKSFVVTGLTPTPEVKAYPNPVKGIFSIEIPDEGSQVSDLPLFNSVGERIDHILLSSQGNWKKAEYDFSGLPSGVYYLRIVSNNITRIIKVVNMAE